LDIAEKMAEVLRETEKGRRKSANQGWEVALLRRKALAEWDKWKGSNILDSVGSGGDDEGDEIYVGGSGRYPYNRGKHLLVAVNLWVYGDESGIEGDGPYCVVAGFVGSPRHWNSFNSAWEKVIGDAEVEEFHARKFFNRRSAKGSTTNPFHGWSADKAVTFLNNLLGIIRGHSRISPVACSLNVSDFLSFTWGERQFFTGGTWSHTKKRFLSSGAPTRLYHVPAQTLIADALHHVRTKDCKVHFVLDEQSVMQDGFLDIVKGVRDRPQYAEIFAQLGDVAFGSSAAHPGIQAADLLAHCLYSNYLRREKLDDERLFALTTILGKRWRRPVFTAKKLEMLLDKDFNPKERPMLREIKSPSEIQKEKAPS
jgi:hypothetical protein